MAGDATTAAPQRGADPQPFTSAVLNIFVDEAVQRLADFGLIDTSALAFLSEINKENR